MTSNLFTFVWVCFQNHLSEFQRNRFAGFAQLMRKFVFTVLDSKLYVLALFKIIAV